MANAVTLGISCNVEIYIYGMSHETEDEDEATTLTINTQESAERLIGTLSFEDNGIL